MRSLRSTDLLALYNLRNDGLKPNEVRRMTIQLSPLDKENGTNVSALVQIDGFDNCVMRCHRSYGLYETQWHSSWLVCNYSIQLRFLRYFAILPISKHWDYEWSLIITSDIHCFYLTCMRMCCSSSLSSSINTDYLRQCCCCRVCRT